MTSILDGIRIVDMTEGLAGPMAAQFLAEQGADVIKVERPGGDPTRSSAGFSTWNRSKRGVVLDLSEQEGRDRLEELLGNADVLLHGLRPSKAQGLGLDDLSLADRHPHLVVSSVLGYPLGHPDAERPGYDILVQARSGAMDEVVGSREGPIFLRFPLPSWAAVYLATIGVLARLLVRQRTGRVGPAHTSLHQGMAAAFTMIWNRVERPTPALVQKVPLPKREPGMALSMFECGDGLWLQTLLGYTEHPLMIETLAEMGEIPIVVDTFRPTSDELELFQRAFRSRPRQQWLDAFYAGDVPAAPLSHLGDLFTDPQVLANGFTVDLDHPQHGRVRQVAAPFATVPPSVVRGQAPGLDEQATFEHRDAPPTPTPQGDIGGQPLEGLRVLDFGMYVAGPFGPAILADLGADVIKVEPLGGDRVRPLEMLFLGYGRGRRSIALDLAHPKSREILDRLIRWADVVHHNLRLSAANRLGIDADDVKRINPDAVYCHVSAYGYAGEKAEWPSYDATAQAMSGWPQASVGEGHRPMNYRYGMFDPLTAMASVVPILLTLLGRERGVEVGSAVTTSLLAIVTASNSETMLRLDDGALVPIPRVDAAQTGLAPGYRIYEVADSRWVAVAALGAERAASLRSVAGVSSDVELEAALRTRSSDDLLDALDAAGVPAELVRTDRESGFFDDEQAPGGVAITVQHPTYGLVEQPGRFWSFGDLRVGSILPAPLLGEHTGEILKGLGYDDRQIAALLASRIVASA